MPNVDPDNEATFETCVIPSDQRETVIPKQAILRELERHQYSEEDAFAVKLALEEALSNAIKHGNGNDPSKSVTVRFAVSRDKAVVIIRDEGPGFEPAQVPDCTAPERLPLPNGRGIMLIQSYMDEVCFRDNGRELYLLKRRG